MDAFIDLHQKALARSAADCMLFDTRLAKIRSEEIHILNIAPTIDPDQIGATWAV